MTFEIHAHGNTFTVQANNYRDYLAALETLVDDDGNKVNVTVADVRKAVEIPTTEAVAGNQTSIAA